MRGNVLSNRHPTSAKIRKWLVIILIGHHQGTWHTNPLPTHRFIATMSFEYGEKLETKIATINQCIISYDTVMKVYHIYKNVKYVPVYVRLINFPHALSSSSCIVCIYKGLPRFIQSEWIEIVYCWYLFCRWFSECCLRLSESRIRTMRKSRTFWSWPTWGSTSRNSTG